MHKSYKQRVAALEALEAAEMRRPGSAYDPLIFRWPDLDTMNDAELLAELDRTIARWSAGAGYGVRFVAPGVLAVAEDAVSVEARVFYGTLAARANALLAGGVYLPLHPEDAARALDRLRAGVIWICSGWTQGQMTPYGLRYTPCADDVEDSWRYTYARRVEGAYLAYSQQLGVAPVWEQSALEAWLEALQEYTYAE